MLLCGSRWKSKGRRARCYIRPACRARVSLLPFRLFTRTSTPHPQPAALAWHRLSRIHARTHTPVLLCARHAIHKHSTTTPTSLSTALGTPTLPVPRLNRPTRRTDLPLPRPTPRQRSHVPGSRHGTPPPSHPPRCGQVHAARAARKTHHRRRQASPRDSWDGAHLRLPTQQQWQYRPPTAFQTDYD